MRATGQSAAAGSTAPGPQPDTRQPALVFPLLQHAAIAFAIRRGLAGKQRERGGNALRGRIVGQADQFHPGDLVFRAIADRAATDIAARAANPRRVGRAGHGIAVDRRAIGEERDRSNARQHQQRDQQDARPQAAAGAAKSDCGKPPDKAKDPIAYARWQRECERRQKATGATPGEGMQLLRIVV